MTQAALFDERLAEEICARSEHRVRRRIDVAVDREIQRADLFVTQILDVGDARVVGGGLDLHDSVSVAGFDPVVKLYSHDICVGYYAAALMRTAAN